MKNRVITYYIQTLSPVHVGSGVRWRSGLDYFAAGGRTWLIGQTLLEKELSRHPQALAEFAEADELDVRSLTARHGIDLKNIVKTSYRGQATAQDMFEFVRTGTGIPFIPGSSLKGALRTALLWELAQDSSWQEQHDQLLKNVLSAHDARFAGQPFTRKAFYLGLGEQRSREPNYDLMRVFHLGDAHFSPEDLELADTRIFNLANEHSGGWKDLARHRNLDKPAEATQLAAEALRVGAAARVEMQVDEFLLQSPAAARKARFSDYQNYFENLAETCNHYAARQIERQLDFARQYGLTALATFYTDLQRTLAGLPEGEFLLRLSWGSGWQGMTGELIEAQEDLLPIREKFNLGKYRWEGEMPEACPVCGSREIRPDNRREGFGFCFKGKHSFKAPGLRKVLFPIFPKTRKVVLVDQQPRYPLGWVRFYREMPEVPPAEDRGQFRPPAFQRQNVEASARETALRKPKRDEKDRSVLGEFKSLMKESVAAKVRQGDKLRAEVIKIEGKRIHIRLLQKDEGRELSFTESYLPTLKIGDTVLVIVERTSSDGMEVTGVKFRYKVNK